jgi:hypothetical protein
MSMISAIPDMPLFAYSLVATEVKGTLARDSSRVEIKLHSLERYPATITTLFIHSANSPDISMAGLVGAFASQLDLIPESWREWGNTTTWNIHGMSGRPKFALQPGQQAIAPGEGVRVGDDYEDLSDDCTISKETEAVLDRVWFKRGDDTDHVHFVFPTEAISLHIRSQEEIDGIEEAEEQASNAAALEQAQRIVGYVVKSVKPGCITLLSPDGEEVEVASTHRVWDYGQQSDDWLFVGHNRLPN